MRKAIVMIVVLGASLTGCVGIPTSGGVVTGPVIDDQSSPDFVFAPSGPQKGADQSEILEDFMLAQRSPQGGFAVAKQFLSKDMATAWNPEAGATVRTGIPALARGEGVDTITYTVTSRAYVNAQGQYSEIPPVSQTFEYSFVRENGEWRISEAPNGVVLSQASFQRVFSEHALYFFDPSYSFLVPDVRWLASRPTVVLGVVRELVAGPASWLSQGVVLSGFPIATTVQSVDIVSGTATVELSAEALGASPPDRDRMRQQLAATLDVATVVMRVGGLVLQTPEVGIGAVKNPQVEPAVLVGTAGSFGFDTSEGITSIAGLSAPIVAAGATEATLTADKQSAAILTPGGVAVARTSNDTVAVVDSRSGLIAPSIDPFRFVWSVQAQSAATLSTFGVDGIEHPLQSGLLEDAAVVSIDVSRDGTRLLLYAQTAVGPKLYVAGIIRQQGSNIPTALGELLELPVVTGKPIDSTWIDDRTVATVSQAGEVSPVTLVEIGGPSAALGQLADATTIAGGSNATEGLRVMRPGGEIWRTQGGGWVSTGLTASFMGTKQ